MATISNTTPPNLPLAPNEYDRQYQDQLNNVLRLYFNLLATPQAFAVLGLNFDVPRLPTEADLGDLRVGDVYRDTTADNALKVKV